MTISFIGEQKVPAADLGTDSLAAITIDKDAAAFSGMTTGDVMFVYVVKRTGSGTWSVTTTGGQTWSEVFDVADASGSHALYTAVFNGTWTADPVFTHSAAAAPVIAWAFVLRGVDSSVWDVSPTGRELADTNDQDTADFSTATNGAWGIWGGFENDDNTVTATNIAVSGSGNVYWRNANAGGQLTVAITRKLLATAGALGAETLNYSANDPGRKWSGAIKMFVAASTVERAASLEVTDALITAAGARVGAEIERAVAIAGDAAIATSAIRDMPRAVGLAATAAINAAGGVPSAYPYQVQNLVATAVSTTQINLSWDDVSALAGEAFDIERNDVVVLEDYTGPHAAGDPYPDTGLDPATEYTYRVRAVGGTP